MKSVTSMAAQFTPVTLEEMETLIHRSFHALQIKKNAQRGEIVLDIYFSPKVGVRVWTSVREHGLTGADVGDDAIRVVLFSFAKNGPLVPKSMLKIVKRTQGWKDTLRERIEENLERYDDHEEDIEAGKFIDWSK